ncbi:golgin subfamily A member 6-like protein 7 [Pongo abelii]|uniref:golgin subfamily A member 6-like protein 7 n=1 Tax=Pongo abelii TaxID=9601 RepID=UPI00300655A5
MWPQPHLPPLPMMSEKNQQSKLPEAKEQFTDDHQWNSAGAGTGATDSKQKKINNGTDPEKTTSGGYHSPEDEKQESHQYQQALRRQLEAQDHTIRILMCQKTELETALYYSQDAARKFEEESKDLAGCLHHSWNFARELQQALSAVSTQHKKADRYIKELTKERDALSLELYRNTITNEELKEKNAELQEKLRLVETEKSEIQLHIKELKRKLETGKILLPQVQTNTLQEEKMWNQEEELRDQKEKLRKQEEKMWRQEQRLRKQEKELCELEEQMRKQEEQMWEQDKQMRKQEEHMCDLEGQMRKQGEEMQKKEEQMMKQEEQMWEQEKQMMKQEEHMCDLEGQMRKQEEEMRKQEEQMRKQEEQMRKQEEQMQKQEEQMWEQDKQMQKQEEQMQEQEEQMRKQEEQMQEKEEQMQKQEQMRKQEEQMCELEEQMRMQEEQMREQDERLRFKEERLWDQDEKMQEEEEKMRGQVEEKMRGQVEKMREKERTGEQKMQEERCSEPCLPPSEDLYDTSHPGSVKPAREATEGSPDDNCTAQQIMQLLGGRKNAQEGPVLGSTSCIPFFYRGDKRKMKIISI